MMSSVLNRYLDTETITADDVYIGRGSPWGNPFRIGVHGNRDEVCDRFEREVLPTLDLTPLIGKNLVCYCAPARCHGNSILRAIEQRSQSVRRFFYHPESDSFWATDDRDPDTDGLSDGVTRDEYLAGILAQFHAAAGPRRVVVFGGRTFADEPLMISALDDFNHDIGISLLIEGEQDGADKMARQWAESRGVPVLPIEAQWTALGNVAGTSRNARMLQEGRPDCGIAFPGDVGTADMKSQCELAGVPVFEIE